MATGRMTGQAALGREEWGMGTVASGHGVGAWLAWFAASVRASVRALMPALMALLTGLYPAAVQAQKASPELTACVAANRQAAADLLQARDSETRRHALHAVLVSRLQGLGGNFNALKAAAARNPRNLAECEKTAEAVAVAREQLERVVGTPAQLAECTTANKAGYGGMQATLLALQSSGKASVPALEAAASRLGLLRPAMNREGLTLADCRQLASEVQAEELQVQRLVAAGSAPAAAAAAAPPSAAAASAGAAATAAAATACRAAQTREYNEVAQAYALFVGSGSLAPEWMPALQSLSERLTRLSVNIATPGAPGWDCEGINRALAQARGDLGQLKR